MQSELKSLSKIFSEVIFRIPDYQRGYSWEEKHLKDFWSDIEQLPKDKSHYTGVLTLEPVTQDSYQRWDDDIWIIEAKRYSPMYVVDGQQRLTTAVILLQSILDRINDGDLLNYTEKEDIRRKYICEVKGKGISRSYIFGYEKDNPSYEFLKQKIFGDESVNHSLYEETIYTKNLLAAKKYFAKKLESLDENGLGEIYTKLTQHLQFNIFYIEQDLDVFVTFETMNNRGKLLSHLELLKNRLIYLSTKFDVEKRESEHLRKAINESWKAVYHFLGLIDSEKFNDDVFLRTHYVVYFGAKLASSEDRPRSFQRYLRYEQRYKDALLEEVFTPKRLFLDDDSDPLLIEDVYDYAASIKSVVKVFYEVAYPDLAKWSDQEKVSFNQINRLSDYNLFLLVVASVLSFKHTPDREHMLISGERFGFISRLVPYHADLELGELTMKVLSGDGAPLQISKVMDDACDKVIKSSEFKDAIKGLGKHSNGYYGWYLIRYFMFEYEQHLRVLSKTSRQLLSWSEDSSREIYAEDYKTVEHIYPQQAKDGYWKSKFAGYSVPERNKLRNSIGNLLPVSHGKNASLSNKSFHLKKGSEKNQVGYKYGCLSEIQVSNSAEWGPKEILRRGIYLLDFMEKRWSFKIGDAAKKAQWLGLSFVLEREKISVVSLVADEPIIPTAPDELVEERSDALEF
ncbi:Protein of unknown function [Pseudomonas sp. NFPP07]|uniref:DUF262 domain-containing protein n=1 Tax=Pseudomonas sp. NFPP07 TaxID=1566213 RepID=UPI0008E6037C|nr:DUF262 domain-containing protein [Pseudomonas sp. NFPP07]SFQ38376.1 Protein of unknown function [Pseudomonas sp. NFPP07]